jgi:hypothetical protein
MVYAAMQIGFVLICQTGDFGSRKRIWAVQITLDSKMSRTPRSQQLRSGSTVLRSDSIQCLCKRNCRGLEGHLVAWPVGA